MREFNVAIIGAGPASLYAAEKLSKAGTNVVIFNRDIKPGGLAEFGIYPNKYKMKGGLRAVFDKILSDPKVHYYGNVRVGEGGAFTLDEVRSLGFDAVLVAVGAQGTKWLNLPGERTPGVYHAKDLVYHYNNLPPFAEKPFQIGNHACVVGIGNVALDIVHWLVCEKKVATVTLVARRGPAEAAYTDKEMKTVAGALDLDALRAEFARVGPGMTAIGQEPAPILDGLVAWSATPLETETGTRLRMRFLRGPVAVATAAGGAVTGLTCDVNVLKKRDDGSVAVSGTGEQETIPCDTVVFAIGDSIEPAIGLPVDPKSNTFPTVAEAWSEHPERPRYMVFDPATRQPMWGTFVVGWSRKASDGLVGKARLDALQGCDEVNAYLEGRFPEGPGAGRSIEVILTDVKHLFGERNVTAIDHAAITKLNAAEGAVAKERGLPEFKYGNNAQMLDAIRGGAVSV